MIGRKGVLETITFLMDHVGGVKEEGQDLKTGKFEQLREEEGWIVSVLRLKTAYV